MEGIFQCELNSLLNTGWIWSKNTMTADNWLLDVKLRVTGRGRVGADGMVRESEYNNFYST